MRWYEKLLSPVTHENIYTIKAKQGNNVVAKYITFDEERAYEKFNELRGIGDFIEKYEYNKSLRIDSVMIDIDHVKKKGVFKPSKKGTIYEVKSFV